MGLLTNHAGIWKDGMPSVNGDGIIKPWQQAFVKDAGVWKEFYSAQLPATHLLTIGIHENAIGYNPYYGIGAIYPATVRGFPPHVFGKIYGPGDVMGIEFDPSESPFNLDYTWRPTITYGDLGTFPTTYMGYSFVHTCEHSSADSVEIRAYMQANIGKTIAIVISGEPLL